ncbi:MAG: hypothetical protein ACPG7F_00010 [Aggregatilineales bacterium]
MPDETQEKRGNATFWEGRLNVGWTRQYSRINSRHTLLLLTLEGELRTDATVEQIQKHTLDKLEAVDELDKFVQSRSEHIAKILKSVPRSWLSDNAPKKLDWTKAESLDWLKPGFDQLLIADITELMTASQKKAMNLSMLS